MRTRKVAGAIATFLAAVAFPAQATFHLMRVVEVFPGTAAAPNAQYVVIQMFAFGQNLVGGHDISVFNAAGALVTTFTFDNNVANGANQAKLLIATTEAQTFFGLSADLTMTPALLAAGGKVCFSGTIDCVAWGAYTGSSSGVGTPFNVSGGLLSGKAAIRRLDIAGSPSILDSGDDTDNCANDFRSGLPAPRNNANVLGTIPAATCGNGVIEGLEECDDHNLIDGDGCSSICTITSVAPIPLLTTDQYLWMVPPAANTQQQGFLRLINRQNSAGLVTVWGLDSAGRRSAGTITLTLSPLEARQFNSQDLELGNVAKGLTGSIGSGIGNWTVVVRTALDLEALAYIRTPDGFLTSMHDRVVGNGVDWPVPMFNPADNPNQVSHLRVINTNVTSVSLQITGNDDAGVARGPVTLTIPALSSVDLSSVDLESGNAAKGLIGSLGNGTGKWRLNVAATGRVTVQSLLYDPLGKLTNLSTIPDLTQAVPGQRVLWLVPPASNTQQQGFVRLINRENRASTVTLRGVDDIGVLSPGTASFTLAANASAQFNSQDLEAGNAGKGLTGSLGDGTGNWRLLVTTDLNLLPMGLIRTPDGFLTTVHDIVSGDGLSGNVLIFNPADNPNQVSVLRLVNPNAAAVNLTIHGVDDPGSGGVGGNVTLSLAAGAATELNATDLENGNSAKGLSGSLGNGSGKWRLTVTATAPVKMLSLLRDPHGFLTDLSTGAKGSSGKLDP